MATITKTQLQVRIDKSTKEDARRVLAELGMDASTAVNILFRQIARTGTFPLDLRDVNGFSRERAAELRSAVRSARKSRTTFANSKELLHDLRS